MTALKNINVVRSTLVYVLFFILLSPMFIFEYNAARDIMGFDNANNAARNCNILVGIVAGCGLSYFTFGLRKWSTCVMTTIAFGLTIVYLSYFLIFLYSPMDKELLIIPLSARGAAAVIIAIIYITSIAQSGMSYYIFPQGLAINSFTSRILGITLGYTLIGELFDRRVERHLSGNTPSVDAAT